MVRPVENIRKEMDSLNQATHLLAEEFNRLYTSYLDSLGMVLRRQVVMATYHLCTQVYPERFLALSLGQRQALQRDIRQLGERANHWLQSLLDPSLDLDTLDSPESISDQDGESDQAEAQSPSHLSIPSESEQGQDQAMDGKSQVSEEKQSSDPGDDFSLPILLKRMVMAALAEDLGRT